MFQSQSSNREYIFVFGIISIYIFFLSILDMIWPDLHRICRPATFHSQDAIHKLSMTHIYIWLLKVVQMKFISI